VRDPIQDLDTAGCAARSGATLVEVWNSLPDCDVEQRPAIWDILDRDLMEIGDPVHD
jgi:hypothetical protein